MSKRMSNFRSTALATGNGINDSAYDDVKKIADVIPDVTKLAAILDSGVDFSVLAEVLVNIGDESAAKLAELATVDLIELTEDLAKGSYLGNRKTDINLSLNMIGIDVDSVESDARAIWTDATKTVQYDYADVTFVDGEVIRLNFEFDATPVTISTHADLLSQFNKVDIVTALAQVDTISSITPVNNATYTVSINNVDYSYTAGVGVTVSDIITGLLLEINVTQTNGIVPVTASTTGTTILLTGDVPGEPFVLTTGANLFSTTTVEHREAGVAESAFLKKLKDTSIATFADPVVGEIVRAYDVIGVNSNIERIQLHAVSGSFKEESPMYYWGVTTSALETLAMRAGDVIALGNNIDNLIKLADSVNELLLLQSSIPELVDTYTNGTPNGDITLYNKLTELLAVYNNLNSIISVHNNKTNIDIVANNETSVNDLAVDLAKGIESNIVKAGTNIEAINTLAADLDLDASSTVRQVSDNMDDVGTVVDTIPTLNEIIANLVAIQNATANADTATAQAALALSYTDQLTGLTVEVVQLTSGSAPSQSYNSTTNVLTLGIPVGLKGDRGEAFTVAASGPIASRTAYDGAATGFSFLSLDEDPTLVYFKKSDTSGDWSVGVPFGKGDKGEKGDTGKGILGGAVKTSTTGLTDTYTITYTDNITSTFTVKNGKSITTHVFHSTTDASGLAGKSGATDTYRTSFNDGTHLDFPIYNGLDSSVLSVAGKTGDVALVETDITDLDKYTQNQTDIKLGLKEDKTSVTTKLALKQDKLVSGTNIKKINGEDVTGAGDIVISSGTKPLFEKALFGGL